MHKAFMFALIFAHSIVLCNTQAEQSVTHKATEMLTGLYEKIVQENVIGIENLKRLLMANDSINPLTDTDAAASDKGFVYKKQVDTILQRANNMFDNAQIKKWAEQKLFELDGISQIQEEVQHKTQDIYRTMSFVEIPPGTYTSAINGKQFKIPQGIEIQDTELTQHQWTSVMGNNPSHFVDGPDAGEIFIKGKLPHFYDKHHKMQPNNPVENVSYSMVQEFITRLNDQDPESDYFYLLPSVNEYQAIISHLKLKSSIQSSNTNPHQAEKFMIIPTGRIADVIGNVWEWTRDSVRTISNFGTDASNVAAHLVFGGSYNSTVALHNTSITRYLMPILSDTIKAKFIGLRLVRIHKMIWQLHMRPFSEPYKPSDIVWTKADTSHPVLLPGGTVLTGAANGANSDTDWKWSEKNSLPLIAQDEFIWVEEYLHKNAKNDDERRTINAMFAKLKDFNYAWNADNPLDDFLAMSCLVLMYKHIVDVHPIAQLTPNLKELHLDGNNIANAECLSALHKMEHLVLSDNKISNISFVSHMPTLRLIALDRNPVEDLSPAQNHPSIKKLHADAPSAGSIMLRAYPKIPTSLKL